MFSARQILRAPLRHVRPSPQKAVRDHLTGRLVAPFEEQIAKWYGKQFCVAMNSATTGLLAVALALDVCDAEVITTPKSFGATWGPFLFLKNRLRFARVNRDGNIAADSIQPLVSDRTRAIVAVDFHGPHNMRAVRRIADKANVSYIADAARSFGQMLDGRPASSVADVIVLSFGPGKPMDLGEGGAVVTDDGDLYEKVVRITQHPDRVRREFSLVDCDDVQFLNGRMHPAAVALGLAKIDKTLAPDTKTFSVSRNGDASRRQVK